MDAWKQLNFKMDVIFENAWKQLNFKFHEFIHRSNTYNKEFWSYKYLGETYLAKFKVEYMNGRKFVFLTIHSGSKKNKDNRNAWIEEKGMNKELGNMMEHIKNFCGSTEVKRRFHYNPAAHRFKLFYETNDFPPITISFKPDYPLQN